MKMKMYCHDNSIHIVCSCTDRDHHHNYSSISLFPVISVCNYSSSRYPIHALGMSLSKLCIGDAHVPNNHIIIIRHTRAL